MSNARIAIDAGKLRMHGQRKRMNRIALTLSLAAMGFGLFWLAWILFETIRLGIGGMALSIFTEMTPPPQAETGGLANAICGSLVMVGLATLLGTPIGIMAGVYLAEYGQKTWLGSVTGFINDILLSAPSIVIGLFIYAVVVAQLQVVLGLCRRAGAGADRHPGGHPHHREHAQPDPQRAARSRLCAGHAEVEGDLLGHAEGGAGRRHHRHPAGAGAHRRRDGAAAVHRAVQPVLDAAT